MLSQLKQVITALREEGLRYTLFQIIFRLLGFPAGLVFAVYDHLIFHDQQDIAIMIRTTKPESDTYGLLSELAACDTDRTLHILSYQQVNDTQLTLWDSHDVTTTFSRLYTLSFFRALAQSQIILYKNDHYLKWYRLFDMSDRRHVRLYHGPITKAYGTTRTASRPRTIAENTSLVDMAPKYRSVNSDTERYFRASAEGRHPGRFPKWGYPRFNRVRRFITGESEPILPDTTRTILEPNGKYTNILYATTHKDGAYPTTFFPFSDFNVDRFRVWCRDHDIRIFLRPHPSSETPYEHLVDNETIYFAGQDFANSATELVPFMDGLVTDYSSIYMEYLLIDRPIVFVKDRHERFMQVRGLAFDYDRYFPGPKPATFDEYLTHLAGIANGDDKYADERAFVRETFIPEHDRTFLEAVYQELGL